MNDDDKDAQHDRRDWRIAREKRYARPAMQLISKCIDAEDGSVYKMALRFLNSEKALGGRNASDQLLERGFLDDDDGKSVRGTVRVSTLFKKEEKYCFLDDINAGVLEAYVAGYMAAFTGKQGDEND